METTKIIIDSIGWVGSLMLIAGYWLNSKGKIDAQSISYQLLNAIGSVLLIANTIYYGAYPSSAVNIIWVFIGIFYIAKIVKKEKIENI